MPPSCWCRSLTGFIALSLLGLAATGCASSKRGGLERPLPQPLLFGRTAYFDGAIVAETTLGPFRLNPAAETLNRRPPGPGEGEPIPVSRGGFGQRGERDAGTGFPRGFGEEGSFGTGERVDGTSRDSVGRTGGVGGLPRQMMVVTLRSTASEPVTLRVVEVKSALGNFVPVPETFTLAAGAVQELEPMRASYPAPIDELELLIVLRAGGREESKVTKLTLAEPAPPR